jgi:hypothetical protein
MGVWHSPNLVRFRRQQGDVFPPAAMGTCVGTGSAYLSAIRHVPSIKGASKDVAASLPCREQWDRFRKSPRRR